MTTQTTTPSEPVDDFDAVFDAITKLDEHGKESDTSAGAAPVEVKAPETTESPATSPEAKAPETTESPAAPAPVVETPPAPVDPTARIAELEAELAVAKKTTAAAPAEPVGGTEPAAPAAAVAPPEIEWYKPTADETAILTEHAKEWPEIAKAEEIRTKAAVYNAVQFVFAEITAKYGPVLDRFKQTADAMEETLALQEIRSSHQDYDTVRDKVVGWVETLPVAFRAGAQEIMKRGTPEEVSSLIAEFKKQTATTETPPATPTARDKTELSAAAKKAASNLSVVDSKRTSVPAAAPDKNDFDGAWNEASAAG